MSHCIEHTQCPECVKLGKDRSGDNLAIYDDGSQYCFCCGFSRQANGMQKLRKATPRANREIQLPFDSTNELPLCALEWLKKYSLTDLEIQIHNILWSDHWKRLIFPYIIDGNLIAWQGRSFDTQSKAKWFSQGNIHEFLHIVGNTKADRIVLTEDVISAIRVARQGNLCAMPIFGSHVSTKTILRLKRYYDTMDVWLDYDKAKESMKFSNTIRQLNCKSSCIITPKDPKEYSDEEITAWLYNS